MILHQSVGVKIARKSVLAVGNIAKEPRQVLFIPKDTLPSIPSCDDMIQSSWEMDARFPSHDNSLSKNHNSVNT